MPKIATFIIFLCITKQLSFVFKRTYFYAPNVVIRSFFKLRTIKQPKNMHHEAK